jgi:hypothetical protein
MAVFLGLLLDLKCLSRRNRAFFRCALLFVLANAVFVAGVFPIRKSHRGVPLKELLDVTNPQSAGYMALYVFYGCVLSIYSAFYKVFNAADAAVVLSLDNKGTLYQNMFGSYWGLITGSTVLVLIIIVKRVSGSTEMVVVEGTRSNPSRGAVSENEKVEV